MAIEQDYDDALQNLATAAPTEELREAVQMLWFQAHPESTLAVTDLKYDPKRLLELAQSEDLDEEAEAEAKLVTAVEELAADNANARQYLEDYRACKSQSSTDESCVMRLVVALAS